jgi:tRNA(fMet)-specific endonuclease VapC
LKRLLLDTTFLIDADRSATGIAQIDDDDDVAIAVITVAELLVGVELASGKRRSARQAFVEDLRKTIPVIAYDSQVAERHAALLVSVRKSGRPRGAHDLLIAATAVATERIVVSADPMAFSDLPGVLSLSHR